MRLERLRELREERDLKQSAIAADLNITQKAYSNYETGNRQIPLDILIKAALYFDTSIDYILQLTDSRVPYRRTKQYYHQLQSEFAKEKRYNQKNKNA